MGAVIVLSLLVGCGDDDGYVGLDSGTDSGLAAADAGFAARILVPNRGGDTLSEIDALNLELLASHSLADGAGPLGVEQAWFDGERVVVQYSTREAIGIVGRTDYRPRPGSLRPLPPGVVDITVDVPRRRLYFVTGGGAGALHILDLDSLAESATIAAPGAQHVLVRATDGRVYVFGDRAVRVVDAAGMSEISGSPFGLCCSTISAVVMDPGSRRIFLADLDAGSTLQRRYTYNAETLALIDNSPGDRTVAMSADTARGRLVIVRSDNLVYLLDTTSLQTVPNVSAMVPGDPIRFAAVDAARSRLLLTQPTSLRVLDLEGLRPVSNGLIVVGPDARAPVASESPR